MSLALHLATLVLVEWPIGSAIEVSPALAKTTSLRVTLSMAGEQALLAAPTASETVTAIAVSEAGASSTGVEDTPTVEQQTAAPAPVQQVTVALTPLTPPALPPFLKPPPGSRYFPRSEVSVPAALRDEPMIEPQTELAVDGAGGGKVELRVLVAADGKVDGVDLVSSSLPPAYGEAAVAAFSSLRFRPAEIDGVAVRSEARFEISVDPGETGSSHASDGASARVRRAASVPEN